MAALKMRVEKQKLHKQLKIGQEYVCDENQEEVWPVSIQTEAVSRNTQALSFRSLEHSLAKIRRGPSEDLALGVVAEQVLSSFKCVLLQSIFADFAPSSALCERSPCFQLLDHLCHRILLLLG